ncbi:DNA polymerase III, delta prime subunit [Nostoc flagelliforme CCNUN1]|uniref:DNA polymerase III, delta prime subunit n=1 Tax=Nostoc flagelliforme CCNUN1 TaxID=2038116 RepID=A0A2K8SVN7_9NOSO|nr:TIR domain-containing protein [Nostoc flagelliforme]AUB39529.1 DNA polymerase III, delta prime subunit [Nostoc flagelliforme CCNUN1]
MSRSKLVKLQYQSLAHLWDLLSEKLSRLRSAMAIESDISTKFQLEQQMQAVEVELNMIGQELEDLEVQHKLEAEKENHKIGDEQVVVETNFQRETSINVFCSYSGKDSIFYKSLTAHLSILKRQGIISAWHDRDIDVSSDWRKEISEQLKQSQVFLFLVSSDYLASDYSYTREMSYALQKHNVNEITVVPIIVRPVDWSDAPFRNLQVLPRNGRPITQWENRDEAFVEIAKTIRQIVEQPKTKRVVKATDFQDFNFTLSEKKYLLHQVFKESGVPTITFVEPANFYRLKMALAHPGRGVVIEGPSGIGKTTALKEALRQLKTSGYDNKITILSARFPDHVEKLRSLDTWQEGIIAIDDFHFLERNLGNHLVNRLKYFADQESSQKIVIVGIPHTRTQLIDVGYDVATRIEIVSMGKTSDIFVEEMIEKGELALNIRFSRKAEIVSTSNGSLNIAQMLCAKLAARENVMETEGRLKTLHCYLEAEIEETKKIMDLKYGEFIRFFSLLNGRKNYHCINLLLELARSEEGYLPFAHTKKTHPHLLLVIEEFITHNHVEKLEKEYPKYKQFIFYNKYELALVIDDPQLIFYLQQTSQSQLRKAIGMSEYNTRNKVFISYSHIDSELLKRLQTYLKPLEKRGLVDRWDDTRIKTGMKWRDEIKKALDAAKIAILLVSSNFLASDFILENELPPLLKAAEEEGALIFSIILDPCKSAFSLSELEKFQTLNPPNKPLSGMEQHEQGEMFDKLLTDIIEALSLEP